MIIAWALKQYDNYGGHIQALSYEIERGKIKGETLEQVKAQKTEWASETSRLRSVT